MFHSTENLKQKCIGRRKNVKNRLLALILSDLFLQVFFLSFEIYLFLNYFVRPSYRSQNNIFF